MCLNQRDTATLAVITAVLKSAYHEPHFCDTRHEHRYQSFTWSPIICVILCSQRLSNIFTILAILSCISAQRHHPEISKTTLVWGFMRRYKRMERDSSFHLSMNCHEVLIFVQLNSWGWGRQFWILCAWSRRQCTIKYISWAYFTDTRQFAWPT